MPFVTRASSAVIAALILIGTLCGLYDAKSRLHAEMGNRRVELALEWPEVQSLTEAGRQPIAQTLLRVKAAGITTLVITEDTLASLETSGEIRTQRITHEDGSYGTLVTVASFQTMERIHRASIDRDLTMVDMSPGDAQPPAGATEFQVEPNAVQPPNAPNIVRQEVLEVPYAALRTMGVGLPPDAVQAAHAAHLRIAGRISNFPGVTDLSARGVLRSIYDQGARIVIFVGDDVLGYRGGEKGVASLLRSSDTPLPGDHDNVIPPSGLLFGEVEFGKQRGDEKIALALDGDFVRVHSIQTAEMGTMAVDDVVDRFVKAVKERNIRFCYIRLPGVAGADPVGDTVVFLSKISKGIERGSVWTGGGITLGAAHPFAAPVVHHVTMVLLGLGVGAGLMWMVLLLAPIPSERCLPLILVCVALCGGLAYLPGDSGRKAVALLGSIAFPTIACLLTFPGRTPTKPRSSQRSPLLFRAIASIGFASAITAIGIVHVVGLLASRPFMVHADQFMGIKAQHAVPVLIVALVALIGGAAMPGETWAQFRARTTHRLENILNEPARYGMLLLGIVALAVLLLIVARTGNDSGVGVSSTELEGRSILDRLLIVRPRTKEFLLGHPFFILACAWWLRGRRRLALPAFVVGAIGQVSMLNTFCHIHTPLVISVWRDVIGLILGTLIGIAVYVGLEMALPQPDGRQAALGFGEDTPDDATVSSVTQ